MFALTKQQKGDLYSELCAEAKEAFARHNPCGIQPDPTSPTGIRCNGDSCGNRGCCAGCTHLGPEGCTVEALACRLWTCATIARDHPVLVKELGALKEEMHRARIYAGVRRSKEENMEWQNRD